MPEDAYTLDRVTGKSAADLKDGLAKHCLNQFMADVESARKELTPAQYGSYLQQINEKAQDSDFFGRVGIEIVNMDSAGHLVVSDAATDKAYALDNAGGIVRAVPSQEHRQLSTVPDHKVKVFDLKSSNNTFSLLLPPGLDKSGSDKFKVMNFYDKKSTNPDGSITHNVSGEFPSKESAWNFRSYASRTNTTFKGSYSTTPDGKLLNSHIAYSNEFSDSIWIGGEQRKMADVLPFPITKFREFGGGKATCYYIDSSYIPSQGTYWSRLGLLPGGSPSFGRYKNYEIDTNGHVKDLCLATGFNAYDVAKAVSGTGAKDRQEETVKRNDAGLVTAVHYGKDFQDAKIEWDDGGVKSLRDMEGTTWERSGANSWKKTSMSGQTSIEDIQISVELSGDIVFLKPDEMRIDKPGTFSISEKSNGKGQVVAEDLGTLHRKYTYKPDGTPDKVIESYSQGAKKVTTEEPEREARKVSPVRF